MRRELDVRAPLRIVGAREYAECTCRRVGGDLFFEQAVVRGGARREAPGDRQLVPFARQRLPVAPVQVEPQHDARQLHPERVLRAGRHLVLALLLVGDGHLVAGREHVRIAPISRSPSLSG